MRIQNKAVTGIILSVALLATAGCSDPDALSQQDIEFISHMDQARFFQKQGELKASTLEARNAIELQPGNPEPYFLIANNLLVAGDALNAQRHVNQLTDNFPAESLTPSLRNQATLTLAEASLLQGDNDQVLEHLESITDATTEQQLQAALLRGEALMAAGNHSAARNAFEAAKSLDGQIARPLVGLSRVAHATGDRQTADALVNEAEGVQPESSDLWLWKAQLAAERSDYAAAEEAYIRALEDIGRYDIMTYQKYTTISELVVALRAQGKSSEAFVYEEILAKSGPGTIKSNLTAATKAYEDGDMDTAARYLEEILTQAPQHEQTSLMLGMVRFRQGNMEEAAELLQPLVDQEYSETASKLLAATRLQQRDESGAQALLANLEGGEQDPGTMALMGIASLSAGDEATGRKLVENSLELAPDNHQLRIRYAQFLMSKGDTAKAQSHLETLRSRADGEVLDQARVMSLAAYTASGELPKAIAFADQWLEQEPQSQLALISRARVAVSQGNNEQALGYLDRAASLAPEDPTPLVAAGNVALQMDNTAEATKRFKAALERSPDNAQALAGITRVMSDQQLSEYMEALATQHPDAMGPEVILLQIALKEGKLTDAERRAGQLIEAAETADNDELRALLPRLYQNVAMQASAVDTGLSKRVLEQGRTLFPEHEQITLSLATLAFQDDQQETARNLLQEVKRLHPESAGPYIAEANYLAGRGEHLPAAELYQLALGKERTVATELAAARSFLRAGQREKSLSLLEDAIVAFPERPELLVNVAMVYQSDGKKAQAQKAYEDALKLSADNIVALNNLAWLHYEAGDMGKASDLARKAFDLSPQNPSVADTYGWIMFKSGNLDESLNALQRAHDLSPDSKEIALHLAEAYRAAGRESEASRLMEKFGGQG